jgi:hypothetical protein
MTHVNISIPVPQYPKIKRMKVTIAETYQKAVDAEVTFSDRTNYRLSELWNIRPLLLVFLRHFG